MDYEDLLVEKKGSIATITLNVPQKLNALTDKMGKSLLLAVDDIAEDDGIRAVIVTGAGRSFCSGADVTAMGSARREESRNNLLQVTGRGVGDVFPRLSKPVIAAINGPAVGIGFSLALSCDIRIASETARFGAMWILRGLVPDGGGSYYLPHIVGTSKALELIFTGKIFDAAEAERLGIVSRVVPHDELMKATWELATTIAQQPPVAIGLAKKIVWRWLTDNLAHQIDLETYAQRICQQTEDHLEGVRAFLEKRPAQFKGR